MKLTKKIKLLTSPEQHKSLSETMKVFNRACDFLSKIAFEAKQFNMISLHHVAYQQTREAFPALTAQFVVRAIDVVANSYKIDRKVVHSFKPTSAVVYDQRILSFKALDLVSMASVDGRLKVPFVIGKYRSLDRTKMKGQADLTLENGIFYLNVVVEIPEQEPFEPKGSLGVDKGIVNIAVTSDGEFFCGSQIEKTRMRFQKLRGELQKAGTKSAKRHLKKISKRQSRFQKDINHQISKKIVSTAKGTERLIALEDLKGIRSQATVRKDIRNRLGNWGFFQLDNLVKYKAKIEGVPVVMVDPKNTSRTCPICGTISAKNRSSQSDFSCVSCNFSQNADLVGALNISTKGLLSTSPSQSTLNLHLQKLLELQARSFMAG